MADNKFLHSPYDEVIARARAHAPSASASMRGGIGPKQPEVQQPQNLDPAAIQSLLDQQEPGRYRLMNPAEVERLERRQKLVNDPLGAAIESKTKDRAPTPLTPENQKRYNETRTPAPSPLNRENQLRVQMGLEPKNTQQETGGNADGGILSDTGSLLWMGTTSAAQNLRELVGRIPLVGEHIVAAADKADQWLQGKDSETLLRESIEASRRNLSREQTEAMDKLWWDSDKGTFGPAWSDPRAYYGGIVQSLPETVLTMGAAGRLAKGAYTRTLAKGGSPAQAAAAAARTATIAGGVTEGLLGGAGTARQVRDEIMRLKPEDLRQSEAIQTLMGEGLTLEQARRQLAEDAATQGFLIAGTATGLFGGLGDRALANMITGRVSASLAGRVGKGAVADGVLEELPQSMAQKLAENYAVGRADPNRELTEGVLNEGLGGLAVGGVMGGGMGALARQRVGNETADAVAPQNQPVQANDLAGMDTSGNGLIEPAPQPPRGPLSRAAERVTQSEGAERVRVQTPIGEIAGTMESFEQDTKGGWQARILGDDGQFYQYTDKDGVQIAPEAAAVEEAAAPQDMPEPEAAEAAPVEMPRYRPFAEAFREESIAELMEDGLSREQAERVAARERYAAPVDATTGLNEGRRTLANGMTGAESAIASAASHASTHGEPTYWVSADVANLGGLNAHVNNVQAEANKHYRALVDIVRQELAKVGIVDGFRTGGDEFGLVVVGGNQQALEIALDSARQRIDAYTREHGLDQVPHPKRKGELGVGLHLGYAQLGSEVSPSDAMRLADLHMDQSKRGNQNVAGSPTEASAETVRDDRSGGDRPEGLGAAGSLPADAGQAGAAEGTARQAVTANAPKREEKRYEDMTEAELRERLKYLAQQAKTNGGWNKLLLAERKKVEKAISARVAEREAQQQAASQAPVKEETPATPEPQAEQPAADQKPVKWFGTREKAEAFIAKKGLAASHEVVQTGKVRFEVKPKAPQATPSKRQTAKQEADAARQRARDTIGAAEGMDTTGRSLDEQIADAIANAEALQKLIAQANDKTRADIDAIRQEAVDAARRGDPRDPPSRYGAVYRGVWERFYDEESRLNPAPINADKSEAASKSPLEVPRGTRAARVEEVLEVTADGKIENRKRVTQLEVTEPAKPKKKPNQAAAAQQFSKNKIFTADKVEAARARLRSKLGQLNSGIDPEVLIDGMTIAGAYIEAGVRNFSDYAKQMTEDFGPKIKPYLLSFWEGARNYPGLDTTGMTSVEESAKLHAELNRELPKEEAKALGSEVKKPAKRTKKTGGKGDTTLTQDWGVDHIDGYGESYERETGNSVKDQFMKDAAKYLGAVADILEEAGYVAHADAKGRPTKPVSKSEGGVAGSGDVTLTMRHPQTGANVYVHVGESALRGVVPTTPSGIAVMFRSSSKEGDRYATGGTNRWAPTDLSAADLAAMITKEAGGSVPELSRPAVEAENDTQANEAGAGAEPAGAESGRVQADEGDRPAGAVPGEPDGRVRAERGRRTAKRAERAGDEGQPGQGAGAEQPVRGDRARGAEPGGRADRSNYRIQPGELKRTGSWKATAEQNVRIVELVKQITAEGRQATPEEKALLTKFTGWGASEIANGIFPDQYGRYKDGWRELGERLEKALTPEEYAQAKRTTQYAHYTSEPIIRSVYNALGRMGFNGGQVLEPGMGIGLFNGLMPDSMVPHSTYTGVEYDSITGNIAKLLYPESNIVVGDFTQTKLPRDFFDAAIGNPPFGQIKIQADPEYRKHNFLLHDYFFAKTIDRVKPGGLLVFVTSKGTMDKANDRARKYLAERADLVGAIRLPQTAFKDNAGTEVVTDVIFLRKRAEGQEPAGEAWAGLAEVQTPQGPAMVNEYFAAHPEMVLGRHAKTGSMYRADEYTVEPIEGDIEELFAKAVQNLPENIYRPERGSQAEAAAVQQRDYDPKVKKEGGVYVADDGTLMQVESGQGVPLKTRLGSNGKELELKPREVEWLKGYTAVRDALKQAQYDQLNDGPWEKSLKALNKAYDAFVKKHGPILAHSVTERENDDGSVTVTRRFKNEPLLRLDTEGALAYALEVINEDGTISKGAVLKGRILNKPAAPEIATVQDALFVSLNNRGRLDIDKIASLSGQDRDAVIAELGTLVYEDPASGWTMADEYLSGNVVRKLKEAEAAARLDKRFARNVEALKNVQPRALAPADITVMLGSAWVPASDVANFAAEQLGESMQVSYSPVTGQWNVEGGYGRSVSEWGYKNWTPADILEGVLNNKTLKVTYRDQDGKTHTDAEGTEKVNDIAKKMRDAFKRWIWSDAKRADRLARHYNENYNNIVPPSYDGSHLTLPGVSSRFKLYPHQKRAIWRIVQQGDNYLAHSVGAGKTFTMIASGMEERRLGLVKKPMYVVPNHMLAQFSKEFLELYPTAQIMVADETNFHTHNRRRFVAQAALNDPDAIIITHSAFGRIGMSPEFTQRFIQDQIDEWQDALEEADKGDRVTRKQIERRIEQLENRLKAAISGAKDNVLSFEELGVDRLYVDEMHEFRKLDFATNRGNVKGIDPSGSQRAMDLMMKVQYLRTKNPSRAIVGASGTPITNTMGELFTVQRIFQPNQLEEDGLSNFDAWSNQFGEVVDALEQNAAGGYESVSRFAKFVNVPELMSRVRSFMDILTSEQLGQLVQRPSVEQGGRQVVVTPSPDGYKAYQKTLEDRIKAIRDRRGPPKPGDDIILNVIADGRFSAIDMRFVDPSLPSDPNSKLNRVLDDMIEAYHRTAENEYETRGEVDPIKGSTLMLFTDIGLGEQSAKSRGFDMKAWIEKRLIEGGVKPEHIAFMRDHKAHAKKERLFEDLRQGRKRILIGGKDMETGVNAQKRLIELFHLDAPWFPASVEQREGRIIRQGNQNKQVRIRAYATKGSYDSTMWGMNARKARFIEQAMTGDSSVRAMEDVSEASAFEMAAALASGDERYLKLAGLKGDVERLGRLYAAHMDDQRRLRSEKMGAEASIKHSAEVIAQLKEAIAQRKPIKAGEFTGKVGGKTYDSREEFSNALFGKFKELAEGYTVGEQTLGEVGGFPIVYTGVEIRGGSFAAEAHLQIPGDPDPLIVFPIDPMASVNGIATRAANQVNGLDRELTKREESSQNMRRRLEQIESRLGAPFAELADLTEKQEALAALEAELEAEGKEANADAAAATAEVEGQGGEPRYSLSAERGGKGMAAADVREAITRGVNGKLIIDRMVAKGLIQIHSNTHDLPEGLGRGKRGIQAVTAPDNTIHLVASNLTPQTANAVLLHEMFHSGVENLVGSKRWGELMGRLGSLYRQAERSSGKAREIMDRARARVADAKAQGAVATRMEVEEFGAYMIEEYESLPTGFRKWVDDLIGAIKAWLFSRYGRQLGKVTPAQLRALAHDALINVAMKRRGELFGKAAERFSSVKVTESPAFKRWFGDSKVVDAEGKPLVVYHATDNDFSVFDASRAGENTDSNASSEEWAQTARMGFWFSDRDVSGMTAQRAVMPVYLSIQNPKRYDSLTWLAERAIPFAGSPQELRAELEGDGYDGIVVKDEEFGGTSYIAFRPEQIKSAVGNVGTFDPENADIRFSVLPDDTALEDATKALDEPVQYKPDFIGQLQQDIGRLAKILLHPRQIAALHKDFAPVYRAAIEQFEMRDSIIDEFQQDHGAYDVLPQASKKRVNAVLELGRLLNATFSEDKLKQGVVNPGSKTVVKFTEGGSTYREKEKINALLSAEGEVIQLSEAEIQAYLGLRKMFDKALDKFKDQTLEDFGFPELVGQQKAAGEILAMIDATTPAEKAERLQNIARFIQEIEQAKRTGYVPFARYGDYVVAVKEQQFDLNLIHDPYSGGWIARDLPLPYQKLMDEIGAQWDELEGGYRLNRTQRQALMKENERTIHSAKVEFTARDRLMMKAGRPVEQLPSVKAALAEAEKWKDGKPNRRIVAFETVKKKPEGGVKLSDVDALAEVAMLDNATWDAVRDQLADAIKGRSFRKHFFQADNVLGYTSDFERAIADYMAGMAGYLSRRHYNSTWDNAIAAIKAPRLFEYANKYRAYANEPQEELAMLRQVGFFSYIAGVPATAFVNLTQPILMTIPALGQIASMPMVMREMALAYKDALAMIRVNKRVGLDFFDPSKAPADIRAELMKSWGEGMFVPLQTYEVMATARQRNVGHRQAAKFFNRTIQVTASLFSFAERLNRLVTFIAAARLAKKPGVKARAMKVYGKNALARQTMLRNWSAESLADFMIDETQFRMGKANRPVIMRGVGAAIMQFKGFVMQSLEAWFRLATQNGKEGVKAVAMSLGFMVLMGGLWGLPGADDLRDLIEKAYKQVTKQDLDLKTELRRSMYELTGQRWIAEVASKGATYPFGLDLSRVGMGGIAPDSPLQVFGIPADLIVGRGSRAFGKANEDDYYGAVAEFLPNFLKNPVTAYGWTQNGVRDGAGRLILDESEVGSGEVGMKSLGFQPSRITDIREYTYAQRRMETANDELKRDYASRLAKAIVKMEKYPEKAAEAQKEYAELIAELQAHNARYAGRPEYQIFITRESLQQRIKREMGGAKQTWGRERKQARGAAADLREVFGLTEDVE